MKRLLALFVFAASFAFAAAPTTLKEVLAQEAKWLVEPARKSDFNARHKFAVEPATAFLAHIASVNSDNERKNAAAIAKLNWKQMETLVLTPAAALDAGKAKTLRAVLERIAASTQAAASDQAELKRLLDSVG